MNNECFLRRGDISDIDALSKLSERTYRESFVETFHIAFPENDPSSNISTSPSPEWFSKNILDPNRVVWVIEDKTNGKLVAYALVGPADISDIPHPELCTNIDGAINCLFVRRDRQSQGFGRQLMSVILPWLEEHHPGRPIWLNVWSANLKAQKFYNLYGFIKVGEAEFPNGEGEDQDYIMKRLPNTH